MLFEQRRKSRLNRDESGTWPIYESIAKKSPENEFFITKDNNSWKSRSTVTKVEFDL